MGRWLTRKDRHRRARRIAELRENDHLTWDAIGKRVGMAGNTAQWIYKRWRERQT